MIWILSILFITTLVGIYLYFRYMEDKGRDLNKILNEHKCPKCNSSDIKEHYKSSGSCGTVTLEFQCKSCGYHSIYTLPTSGCSL